MEMKNKTKTILFSITVISLFVLSAGVKANTLYEIEYPETAVLGDAFKITVLFTYETETDALYDKYVYLFYSVNDLYVPTSIIGDNVLYQGVSPLYPRPESKSFTIRTSLDKFDLAIGDIFRFKIRYINGILWPNGDVTRAPDGMIISEAYSVTITDIVTETPLSFVSIFSTFMILSAIILQITKRGKKQ